MSHTDLSCLRLLGAAFLPLLLACQSAQPLAPAQPEPPAESTITPPPLLPPAVQATPGLPFRLASDGTALPPVATIIPTTRTLHGQTLTDDYAWLRERGNPEVLAYLTEENRYTEAVAAPLKALQETIYAEMLARIQQTDTSVPYLERGYYYYSRTEEGKNYPIYCRKRGSLEAAEEILLDGNELARGHDYFVLGGREVSPDGQRLAYQLDFDGSEHRILRIKDLTTGETLADEARDTANGLAWASDGRTLFYTVLNEANRPYRLFRHTVGARPGNDTLVYEEGDAAFNLFIQRSKDGEFLLLTAASNTTSEIRALDARESTGKLLMIAPRQPGVEVSAEHHGDHFYLRTNDGGAKGFKLLRVRESDPLGGAEEIIPASEEASLSGFDVFAEHLAIFEQRDGLRQLRILRLADGQVHQVGFPEPVFSVAPSTNREFNTRKLRFRYSSLVTPSSTFDYDMEARTRELKKQDRVLGGYDPSLYVSERREAVASDGTRIPVSLVYRRDRPQGGPGLLTGYGAYGSSSDPSFSSSRLSLLDRGFVYAVAHVRGGGEMGERWHDGGKLEHKMNTFTDFIAVAEHLIGSGVVGKGRLAIQGGSAGGLLIGAVINLRPDLFAAAVANAPFVDVLNTMLDPSLPLTVGEYEEWGNPNDPVAFSHILAYSPYDNVAARPYPALLVTTGLNDPRVSYWEPTKWVAKLRRFKTGREPLLLKANLGSGHFGSSGRYAALDEAAFSYAFILDALGLAGETPPAREDLHGGKDLLDGNRPRSR